VHGVQDGVGNSQLALSTSGTAPVEVRQHVRRAAHRTVVLTHTAPEPKRSANVTELINRKICENIKIILLRSVCLAMRIYPKDVKVSRPDWSSGKNFGIGFGPVLSRSQSWLREFDLGHVLDLGGLVSFDIAGVGTVNGTTVHGGDVHASPSSRIQRPNRMRP